MKIENKIRKEKAYIYILPNKFLLCKENFIYDIDRMIFAY